VQGVVDCLAKCMNLKSFLNVVSSEIQNICNIVITCLVVVWVVCRIWTVGLMTVFHNTFLSFRAISDKARIIGLAGDGVHSLVF
jgi:hypothetical protein